MVAIYYVPIDMVYEIPVQGKIYPIKQWSVNQSDGEFHTSQQNFVKGEVAPKRTFVFERGDVVDIRFNQVLAQGGQVSEHDTLFVFGSMRHRLDVRRTKNEQEIQRSLFEADATPDRGPSISLAKEDLGLAVADRDLEKKNTDRFRALHDEGVISTFEYDQQVTALQIAEQQVALAEERLRATRFGQKKEDLNVYSTRIATAESELEVLGSRQASFVVEAPFDGLAVVEPVTNVVVEVIDTTEQALVFPIDVSEMEYLVEGSQLHMSGCDGRYQVNLASDIQQLNGAQVRMASVVLDHHSDDIGGFSEHVISCDTVRLGIYLKRRLF